MCFSLDPPLPSSSFLDCIYQSYQESSLGEAFEAVCSQASKLFEGAGIAALATHLALPGDHPFGQLSGRVTPFTDQARYFITTLQLPRNGFALIEAAALLSAQCAEDSFGWLERINGIRDLIFDTICSWIGDACDFMTLVIVHLKDIPPEVLRVVEAIAGITLTCFALNGLSHNIIKIAEWGAHPTDSYADLGILIAKMLKNLFLLTMGALAITTVLGGVTLTSPWIIFAIVTGHFVISCGIFFAEKVWDTSPSTPRLVV